MLQLTAAGIAPDSQLTSAQASATTEVTGQPALQVLRTSNRGEATVGDGVGVAFVVTNVGPVTLGSLHARDSRLGVLTLDVTQLAPGASAHASGSTPVIEGDLPGPLVGSVVVTGTPLYGGLGTVRATSDDLVVLHAGASVAIDVAADRALANVDDLLTFNVTVTNTGKVTLQNVAAADDRFGALVLDTTTLPPGASTRGVAQVTIGAADLPGPYVSHVTARGALPACMGVITATTTTSVALEAQPALQVGVRGVPGPVVQLGNIVTYTFVVTNTGNVALSNVGVVDSRLGVVPLSFNTLAPGQIATGQRTVGVSENDLPGPLTSQRDSHCHPGACRFQRSNGCRRHACCRQVVTQCRTGVGGTAAGHARPARGLCLPGHQYGRRNPAQPGTRG